MTDEQRDEATLQHMRHSVAYGRYWWDQLVEMYSATERRGQNP